MARRKTKQKPDTGPALGHAPSRLRRWTLLAVMGIGCAALVGRAVEQQIFETDFLKREGARRHLRVVDMPAHRGMITDRRGEPLAISTPVDSVWANPRALVPDRATLKRLAGALGEDAEALRGLLARRSDRAFVYLKRHVTPDVAQAVAALEIPGVGLRREYKRYYPSGEVTAHVVGLTDIDDRGQEGVELAYDRWLGGTPGRKRVVRDGLSRVVEDIESIREPRPGRDLRLSLDRRLQFLAYRELKAAVTQNRARGGTAVILDVDTGEVLAMVNQPSYNPNGSRAGLGGRLRNRALTDVLEPGSTMKPFTIAAALELGRFEPDTPVDTTPGVLRVGGNRVRDVRDFGRLDVAGVIRKSSNVGASKIALDLPKEELWGVLRGFGFGELTQTGFPGEASGQLAPPHSWVRFDQAALAFGYGVSVTPLQLAQAYAVIAADGLARPASMVRLEERPRGERVISAETARAVRRMMEAVVSAEGTAPAAAIAGYRIAGKTGTVKKAVSGGYSEDRYRAVFAGMAPASDPRLVLVVVIDEPNAGEYYGGQVAAPVFSRVMAGALRLLNVTPDDHQALGVRMVSREVHP